MSRPNDPSWSTPKLSDVVAGQNAEGFSCLDEQTCRCAVTSTEKSSQTSQKRYHFIVMSTTAIS